MKDRCKLIFTGDLLPADREHTLGIGVGARIDSGAPLWSDTVEALFRWGDLTLVNLEGPIVNNQDTTDRKSFAGRKGILKYFVDSGITHANVANNHVMEHDRAAFDDTLSSLHGVGIETIGDMVNNRSKVIVVEKNGIIIAFAGFNAIHDLPNPDCYAELCEASLNEILQCSKMRKADIRVLVFHWGNEYIHVPSWDQIEMARRAVDKGVHLVVGHHPHVIQPFEEYKHGLICYSLGNFLFDMMWNTTVRTGAILEVTVGVDGIESWRVHACRYDRACFVSLVPSGWIDHRMKRWKRRMDAMRRHGEDYYKRNYTKQLKRNRLIARIMMKFQLVQQLPAMESAQRKQVITSLFRKVRKRAGGDT